MNEISKYIAEEETGVNEELFKRHFNFQRTSDMLKNLYQINDKLDKIARQKSQIRQQKPMKRFLSLINKTKKDKA